MKRRSLVDSNFADALSVACNLTLIAAMSRAGSIAALAPFAILALVAALNSVRRSRAFLADIEAEIRSGGAR